MDWTAALTADLDAPGRRSGYGAYAAPGYGLRDPNMPFLVGIEAGHVEFTTCTDLVPVGDAWPCWDVNGYYRALGIGWPFTHASLGDIRKAYLALDGPNDSRLTYIFKQLLNKATKTNYDRWPLGREFPDEYVWQAQKRRVLDEMARRGLDAEDIAGAKDIFADMGVNVEEGDTPEPTDILDNDSKTDKDEESTSKTPAFHYAYYLWRTQQSLSDREILAAWQPLLIRALSEAGVRMKISLGLMRRGLHEWSTGVMGRRNVVFFARGIEPSAEVAAKAAEFIAAEQDRALPGSRHTPAPHPASYN